MEAVKEEAEEVKGYLMAQGATGFLAQEVELVRTTPVDACNGFINLMCLEMMWTLRHRWPAGARYTLNLYKHWEQILLCQQG